MMDQASEPIDVLSLAGLGAELWQTVDVDACLEQEETVGTTRAGFGRTSDHWRG
jgi:hypothetical protein